MPRRIIRPPVFSLRIEDRFWKYVEKSDGCWMWFGKSRTGGENQYGLFKWEDNAVSVHRISWRLAHGNIPTGLHVLHKCDTPLCVNPDHLFLGTHQDNMDDMMAKGRSRWQRHRDAA